MKPPLPCSLARCACVIVVPFCLAASAGRVCAQDARQAAAEELVKAAAAADEADLRAADLFQQLASASGDAARGKVITALNAMARSKAPVEAQAITRYGSNLSAPKVKGGKYPAGSERRAVLYKVIPLLIASLDGSARDTAWWVLITVQSNCPAPRRALWDAWWRDSGKALYAPAPAAATAEGAGVGKK